MKKQIKVTIFSLIIVCGTIGFQTLNAISSAKRHTVTVNVNQSHVTINFLSGNAVLRSGIYENGTDSYSVTHNTELTIEVRKSDFQDYDTTLTITANKTLNVQLKSNNSNQSK